jgi:type 1 glutamine amidotransferase
MSRKRIVFHIGGAYHRTDLQAAAAIHWLGDERHVYQIFDGVAAFEALGDADLFVVMGMHWPGMAHPSSGGLVYHPMQEQHRLAFERYVAAGRPLLVHHGAIFSYPDWPRFQELLGFWWDWEHSSYVPVSEYQVRVQPTGHPIVAGVEHFTITDELYVNVQVAPDLAPTVHAAAYVRDDELPRGNGHRPSRGLPLVYTAEGGRAPGAGKVACLQNGHDMRAFECRALQRLWANAVDWLLA